MDGGSAAPWYSRGAPSRRARGPDAGSALYAARSWSGTLAAWGPMRDEPRAAGGPPGVSGVNSSERCPLLRKESVLWTGVGEETGGKQPSGDVVGTGWPL